MVHQHPSQHGAGRVCLEGRLYLGQRLVDALQRAVDGGQGVPEIALIAEVD